MAAARTAAFLCRALRHLFCRSLCSTCSLCPPHLAPCQLFCAPGRPSRATAYGLSEQSSGEAPQTPKLASQPDKFALLDVRSHPSLYTPSPLLLLPILSRGALGQLLPLSSRLLLSVQLPQGLHQVGGSSWVTCKTGRRISL